MSEQPEITEEDKNLLDVFKHLKIKPPVKVESPEDLEHYMEYYVQQTDKDKGDVTKIKTLSPKISVFYGESGKGEVTFPTWEYEVKCLIGHHKEEQILSCIRRSCKGEAANILRRMGVSASLADILKKFRATYSNVDTCATTLKKLYACTQAPNETVANFAARVEEIFAQAIELKALSPGQEDILKNVLYEGLQPNLQQMASYKFDVVSDYDRFKVELRKMEASLQQRQNPSTTSAKCQVATQDSQKTDMMEVKNLLKKLNDRIDKLENNQGKFEQPQPYRFPRPYRGRGRGDFSGARGRGHFQPRRPTGTNTFRPRNQHASEQFQDLRTCFKCNRQGHIARFCPQEN